MSKERTVEEVTNIYDLVIAASKRNIKPMTNKRVSFSEFAIPLRKVLKAHGISSRMVSVTCPNYSMVQSIDIRFPRAKGMSKEDLEKLYEAQQAIRLIINKAFPANHDRSDVMTDYFDYTYTVF